MTDVATAVGVLGGTFDPVHLGHLALADEVRRRLALERILLVPAAAPPHKRPGELSPATHRAAMLRLALAGRDGLELCELELTDDRLRYTIDTLRHLRDGSPPLRPLFILGSDSLLQIHTWRSHRALLAEFDLVVLDRAGHEIDRDRPHLPVAIARRLVTVEDPGWDAPARAALAPGNGGRIFHVRIAPIPISSSAIRERAARGAALSGLVPPAVSAYIERTGLYRQESAR